MGTEHEDELERRRDELRRIVFGTPGEPDPGVAAELAAAEEELAARERGGASEASARIGRRRPTGSTRAAGPTGDSAEGPSESKRRTRRRPAGSWVFVALLGAFLVIAVAVSLLDPVRDALSPPQGLGVFERPQTTEELDRADEVATGAGLQSADIEALRSLGRAFGYDFWVYRDDQRVCMLSQRQYFFGWVETCASLEVFATNGLARRIPADDIRDGARPRRIRPGDVVVVTWGPESTEIEWTVEP